MAPGRSSVNGHTRPSKLAGDSDDEKMDLTMKLDNLKPRAKTPAFIYILTFFSALGGFLFGYDTGVISGAMILLRNDFSLSSVWQELIVSVTIAAAAIFALVGGFLNDRLGRRPVIMGASILFTLGSIMMAVAKDKFALLAGRVVVGAGIDNPIHAMLPTWKNQNLNAFVLAYGIRKLLFIPCLSLTSTTIPMYLAECSPTYARGSLVSTNIAMVAFGQFMANVIDGIFGIDAQDGWRYMLGLGAVPACIQLLGFLFMPESPRWLVSVGREEKARRILQSMRGALDIEEEYENIKQTVQELEREQETRGRTPVFVQMLKIPAIRRSLLVGCSLQIIQQVAGINTVMYYSATIIRMSGVKSDEAAIWLSAVTAAVNFLFTLVGLYLVEKIGRRPLTLGSLMGAIVSLAWLAVGFHLSALNTPPIDTIEQVAGDSRCSRYRTCNDCRQDLECGFCYVDLPTLIVNSSCLPTNYDHPWTSTVGRCNSSTLPSGLTWAYDYCPTPYSWMPMVGLVLYLVSFAPGMGPMPWTINSEIYPLWARSTGNSVSTFMNWTFNLAVSMSFISLTESLTRYGTFWLYACLAFAGAILLALILPETKGRTLEEVEGLFARSWFQRSWFAGSSDPIQALNPETIQYVHIRGLNRDGRESELDSPE